MTDMSALLHKSSDIQAARQKHVRPSGTQCGKGSQGERLTATPFHI